MPAYPPPTSNLVRAFVTDAIIYDGVDDQHQSTFARMVEAVYGPKINDLYNQSRFFGVPSQMMAPAAADLNIVRNQFLIKHQNFGKQDDYIKKILASYGATFAEHSFGFNDGRYFCQFRTYIPGHPAPFVSNVEIDHYGVLRCNSAHDVRDYLHITPARDYGNVVINTGDTAPVITGPVEKIMMLTRQDNLTNQRALLSACQLFPGLLELPQEQFSFVNHPALIDSELRKPRPNTLYILDTPTASMVPNLSLNPMPHMVFENRQDWSDVGIQVTTHLPYSVHSYQDMFTWPAMRPKGLKGSHVTQSGVDKMWQPIVRPPTSIDLDDF